MEGWQWEWREKEGERMLSVFACVCMCVILCVKVCVRVCAKSDKKFMMESEAYLPLIATFGFSAWQIYDDAHGQFRV